MRIAAVVFIVAALVVPVMHAPAVAANDPAGDTVPDAVSGPGGGTASDAPKAPAPAPDAAVDEVFRALGLFGIWAADCGRPPTPDNPHVSVTTPSAGLVLETNDVGPGYAANRYSVLTARRLSAGRLEVTVIFRPGTEGEERQKLEFAIRNGTRRTMFNQVEGGDVRVKNGIVLSRGIRTLVLKKCG